MIEFNFNKKTAIISGGGTGIGFHSARLFLKSKANVIITGRRKKILQLAQSNLLTEFPEYKDSLVIFDGDMSNENFVASIFENSIEKFKSVNILVNNCASWALDSIEDLEITSINEQLNNGFISTLIGTKYAAKKLEKGGSIVNLSSFSSKIPMKNGSIYSSIKSAINTFTKSSASELAKNDIRVNSIIPGVIRTPMTSKYIDENYNKLIAPIALGRVGTCTEVANAILFLSSELSSYITGTTLEVSGGKYLTQN
tara:strand:- start:1045 stop:1809 length:765 start_codon:yes stop_codon:yes gene_type:complete